MLFNYLILAAAVGVAGAISMILSERKRRKLANRKWEEMQRERKKPNDNNNDILV